MMQNYSICMLIYFRFALSPVGKIAKISIRSEGCNDRGKYGHCGRAYIKVNGRDYSTHRRGYNIVVLNAFTGIRSITVYTSPTKVFSPV